MNIAEWLNNDNLAIDIWKNKYQYNDENFEQWIHRVSGGDTQLAELMKLKRFLFGGRILANRGLNKDDIKVTYSNCYVLPRPEDNIESIYETASKLARTFSYGGGVGIDISNLRPKGAVVRNSARETTGAVSFMDTFSLVTETIGQRGRRGALMISMDVNHPDIEDFIDIKKDLTRVTKANISVRITDAFMEAVYNDEPYDCTFEVEATGETVVRTVNAKELFMKLSRNNWEMAEPGILFWDNINNYNLMSEYIKHGEFEYAGVNPCAEETLPAGGSCNLGSINLSAYVLDAHTPKARFDYLQFTEDIPVYIKALNNVLVEGRDLHPLAIQRETIDRYRQIGLGVMGVGDMLIKLGITYGSDLCKQTLEAIGHTLLNESLKASAEMAILRGSFEGFNADKILNCGMSKVFREDTKEYIRQYGLYNSQILTTAPTGSISTMLGISGGIEPLFALEYTRKTESLHNEDVYYKVEVPVLKEFRDMYKDYTRDLPKYFITSHQINPFARVEVQASWQKYIDASISSTINLDESVTVEEVFDIYCYAHQCGLKGLTIYRNNCARSGVLTVEDTKEEETDEEIELLGVDYAEGSDIVSTSRVNLRTGEIQHIHAEQMETEPSPC